MRRQTSVYIRTLSRKMPYIDKIKKMSYFESQSVFGQSSRTGSTSTIHFSSISHSVFYGSFGGQRLATTNTRAHGFNGCSSTCQFSSSSEPGIVDERLVYQAALEDLNQPTLEANLLDGLLSVSLLRHQRIALAWLLQKETRSEFNCLGGILADDQGLGKTISMIALVQMQRSLQSKSKTEEEARTTLVVCPASVVRQWARELDEKVAKEAKLFVLVYHGGNRTNNPEELTNYDVVITTYAIVTNECPKQPLVGEDDDNFFHIKKKRKMDSNAAVNNKERKKCRNGFENGLGPLSRVDWHRVILDEAQMIKNHTTQVARACCSLRAKTRWCLSGTPIQNTIDDLYSYFSFLKYNPYGASYQSFKYTINAPISQNPLLGYKKLQAVLKAIMLRRTKGTMIDGKPILSLPPKTVNLTRVDFSSEERSFYNQLEYGSRAQFKAYAAAGTVNQNYANILVLLLRLRQACDHPLLLSTVGKEDSEDMESRLPAVGYTSSKVRAVIEEVLESHNTSVVNDGLMKTIIFSQWTKMLDLVENALNEYCKHVQYMRLDGTMTLASRDSAVKSFNTDPNVTVILMSLKAGNLGLNMVSASHVIMLDPWWNPTTEDQAVDRAHRIGQTRPVTVTRLTIKGTVEDRILALQAKKKQMVASAFGEDNGNGGSANRLTVKDLRYLFRV